MGVAKKLIKLVALLLLYVSYVMYPGDNTRTRHRMLQEPHTVSLMKINKGEHNSDRWVPVRLKFKPLYVYSAYYDEIFKDPTPVIRVVAAGVDKNIPKIWCNVTYPGGESITTAGSVKDMKNMHRTPYCSKIMTCYLGKHQGVPNSVKIITSGSIPNSLPVHYKRKYSVSDKNSMNVCVRPLHLQYDDVMQTYEFIEYYRMMGATHFTFYDMSMGDNVRKLLEFYMKKGYVTILSYNLPEWFNVVAHGQHATSQDCFLRSRANYKYVINVDMDEYIFPKKHQSLLPLLKMFDTQKKKGKRKNGFHFRRVNFCLNNPENGTIKTYLQNISNVSFSHSGEWFRLLTQLNTYRAQRPCPFPSFGKYIVKPWAVNEFAIHTIQSTPKGHYLFSVPERFGLLHHYRHCHESKADFFAWMYPCPLYKTPLIDTFPHKFLEPLTQRIVRAITESEVFPEQYWREKSNG